MSVTCFEPRASYKANIFLGENILPIPLKVQRFIAASDHTL